MLSRHARVAGDLAGAQWNRSVGVVWLVKVSAWVAPEPGYGSAPLLILGEKRLREIAVIEFLTGLPVSMSIDERPGGVVEVAGAKVYACVRDGSPQDTKHDVLL